MSPVKHTLPPLLSSLSLAPLFLLHSCSADVLRASKHLSVPRQLHAREGCGGGGGSEGLGRGGSEGGRLERRETDEGSDARSA